MKELHELEDTVRRGFEKHLLELVLRPSPSGEEEKAREYVEECLKQCGLITEVDEKGNLHGFRGEPPYVLLSAHLDTTQRLDDVYEIEEEGLGSLEETEERQQGYDDKIGVAIILQIADSYDFPLKVLLSVEEECGRHGVKAVKKSFYEDIVFALVLDRQGDADIIMNVRCNDTASEAFLSNMDDVMNLDDWGYEFGPGLCSDVLHIGYHVDAVNIAVGYYHPHGRKDGYDIDAAMKALNFTVSACERQEELTVEFVR